MSDDDLRKNDFDETTGQSTTGHVWDGIRELNTPLPRWWLWTFYVTIIWSVAYWVVYPAFPLVQNYTAGFFGYSSRAEVATDIAELQAFRDKLAAPLKTASFEEIAKNPEWLRIAQAQGKAAFADNCTGCHGAGGGGGVGYPNLTDDDWIWGGTPEQISKTLIHGARWMADNETRQGEMIGFEKTGILSKEDIATVVEYTRSLSGLDVAAGTDLEKGKQIFGETGANCSGCHGADSKGNQEFGAPDLTDKIWLYGSSREVMTKTVANGRAGIMPAWGTRLDPMTIKALAIYVHTLGGGKQ
jgi:cytochrome c oxidase cbb3-type subunit III